MPASFPTQPVGVRKAVVPAAGFGTRLRPLTNTCPKEMIPVGRRPVLAHVAAELCGAGITHILFVVSERKPQIRAYFGDVYTGENDGASASGESGLPLLSCEYVVQEEQRGSGDAVLRAAEWAGDEPFVVAFGDCLVDAPDPSEPLRRLIATHQKQQAGSTVLVERVAKENVSRYGVLAPEAELPPFPVEPFPAAGIVEKPAPEEAPSNMAVAARFVFSPQVFDYLLRAVPDRRGEINLPDAMQAMRQEGFPLWAVPLHTGEARRDIGNFETFFAAFIRYALRDPEFGASARQVAQEALGNKA